MAPRPFRFALQVSRATSRAAWQDLARRVEDLGFDVLAMPDHVVADPVAELLAPLPALVSAADATTTLRVGTVVLNADVRAPALLAQEVGTVELLTDGRLELGLGAGGQKHDYELLGRPLEAGGVRLRRLAEAVAAVKALPGGGPPLLLGGSGPRLLSLAAREADMVQLTGLEHPEGTIVVGPAFTAEATEEKVAWLRSEAGERAEDAELGALLQFVGHDREAVSAELPELSEDDLAATPFLLVGSTSQMVETLLERRDRFGITYLTAFAGRGGLAHLPPVVAELAGR